MAKKRKTRQEKVIADLRRKLGVQTLYENSAGTNPSAPTPIATTVVSTYSLPQTKPIIQSTPNYSRPLRDPAAAGQLRITNYPYVLSDLKRTVILTTIAIAAQGVLYVVLMR